MIRAPIGNIVYWDSRISKDIRHLEEVDALLKTPSANPIYESQFTLNYLFDIGRLVLRRYSRGDPIPELAQHFGGLLDAWELSNRLSDDICAEHHLKTCRDWTFELTNLNHYNWCFWLVGLALTLDIADEQWDRLLILIGGAGQDTLLDRVIASRQPERVIGPGLLHRKPYARLLKAIDAPKDQQAPLLREFVDHWYAELARAGKDELWWYSYGDPVKHPLEMGSYFGRWCIEAAVAAKVFHIDDSLCLGHEHYPGDLLRPDGPGTHARRTEPKPGLVAKLLMKWRP